MKPQNLYEIQRQARALRRSGATAIEHSGGRRTIFGCLCGSQHSTSTDWNGRQALHVQRWQHEHDTGCDSLFIAALRRRDVAWLSAQRDLIYSNDNH